MSMSARQWAWKTWDIWHPELQGYARITAGEKLVLLALGELENEDFGYAFPKIETLARRCAMGERTVLRHLKVLCASGCVRIEKGERSRDGKWLRNVYLLSVPAEYRETDRTWIGRQADTGMPIYHGHPDAAIDYSDDEPF